MELFDNRLARKDAVPKHIRAVKCEVSSCAYHDAENYCCADTITVGHSYAHNTAQTACTTYKERNL